MRPLIHIGYVKTGSTWLQRRVFRAQGTSFSPLLTPTRVIREELIRPSRLYYDDSRLRTLISAGLQKARQEGAIPLISHERLSGAPVSGGFDAADIAERLHALTPNARVLIVIREQRDHLLSIYREYVNQGGACTLKRFLHQYDRCRIPQFDWRFFCYHLLIRRYQELFGEQNVLVLPFELLRDNPSKFVSSIERFLETRLTLEIDPHPVRRSKPLSRLHVERILNFLFFRTDINPTALFHLPQTRKLGRLANFSAISRIEAFRRQRYHTFIGQVLPEAVKTSNKQTSMLIDQNLERLGYLIPEYPHGRHSRVQSEGVDGLEEG
jgi:hypothetical protein